jgi:hypothetical protein
MTEHTTRTTRPGLRRKPHYIAGTFYALITIAAIIVAAQGKPATLIVAAITAAYSVYLFRGGRIVIFFF